MSPGLTLTIRLTAAQAGRWRAYVEARNRDSYGRRLTLTDAALLVLIETMGEGGREEYDRFWLACGKGTNPKRDTG